MIPVVFSNYSVIHQHLVILLINFFGVNFAQISFPFIILLSVFSINLSIMSINFFFFLCMEGNKKSLVDAMEKGINLREQILQLYNDYYHGELMKLVVIGGG